MPYFNSQNNLFQLTLHSHWKSVVLVGILYIYDFVNDKAAIFIELLHLYIGDANPWHNQQKFLQINKIFKTENLWIKIKSLNTQENKIKTTMQQDFYNKKN